MAPEGMLRLSGPLRKQAESRASMAQQPPSRTPRCVAPSHLAPLQSTHAHTMTAVEHITLCVWGMLKTSLKLGTVLAKKLVGDGI